MNENHSNDPNVKEFIQLKNRIIRNIIKDLFKNKIVCTRKNDILNEQELINILINTSNKVDKCVGITINNNIPNQCTRNSVIDGYCKKHYKKYQAKQNKNHKDINTFNSNITFEIDKKEQDQGEQFLKEQDPKEQDPKVQNKTKKIKKFINDSFYYVDDKYIYSLDLKHGNIYTKVGYIKSTHGHNDEYILSDDPFILNQDYIIF